MVALKPPFESKLKVPKVSELERLIKELKFRINIKTKLVCLGAIHYTLLFLYLPTRFGFHYDCSFRR
jgi:hypothetical protein